MKKKKATPDIYFWDLFSHNQRALIEIAKKATQEQLAGVSKLPVRASAFASPYLFGYLNQGHNQPRLLKKILSGNDHERLVYGTKIKIARNNPIIKRALAQMRTNAARREPREITIAASDHKHEACLARALAIIKKVSPDQYREITASVQVIAFLKAKTIIAATAVDTHGLIFMRPIPGAKEVFFIDHIIHEGSHIGLNAILLNLKDYFRVDPFAEKFSSPVRDEPRGAYHVLQAAFVFARMIVFFNKLLKYPEILPQESMHVLGRILLYIRRLDACLQSIKSPAIFTKKGLKLYSTLISIENQYRIRYKAELGRFSTTTQGREFNLEQFHRENKIKS